MYPGILKSPTAEESLFGKATLRGIPVLIGKAHLKFIRGRPMIGTACVEHGGPPVLVRATRVGLAGTDLVTPDRSCWSRRHGLGHAGTDCVGQAGPAEGHGVRWCAWSGGVRPERWIPPSRSASSTTITTPCPVRPAATGTCTFPHAFACARTVVCAIV